MSQADYEALVADIQDMIDDTGRMVSFVRVVPTAASADKPWKKASLSTGNVITTRVAATFVPPSGSGLGRSFIREDLLKRCDQVCLVAPNAVDFEGCQKIVDGTASWAVEWAQVLKPGDVVLLYAFGIKR
jgi:hypothetical protein